MTTLAAAPLTTPSFTSRVVALGDSITSGEGVGIVTPAADTWAALLARTVGAAEFLNLARAGARLSHVRAEQLPQARSLRPTLATLCVGLNDIVKTGCAPQGVAEDMTALVDGLRSAGATVVVTRLHDPTRVFRLPRGLANQVRRRSDLLNETVSRIAACDPGVLVVDLGELEHHRGYWSVDRVHPSACGQRRLAQLAAERLGFTAAAPLQSPATPPSSVAHAAWLIRCGAPWLARRFPEVGPPVARMAVSALRRR